MPSLCCRGAVIVVFLVSMTLEIMCAGWLSKLIHTQDVDYDSSNKFDHPFVLGCAMFVGQFFSLGAFFLLRCYHRYTGSYLEGASPKFNPFIVALSSMLQLAAVSALYIGLALFGSFLFFGGISVILTAMLSVFFLGRYVRGHMWLGIVLLVIGLVCFGVADHYLPAIKDSSDKNAAVAGAMVFVIAEAVFAGQYVFQEKIVSQYNVHPLLAVGLEGLYGMILTSLIMLICYHIHVPPPFTSDPDLRLSNAAQAFTELKNNTCTLILFIGLVLSTGLSSAFSMTVIRDMSAVTKAVLTSLTGPIVWAGILFSHQQSLGSQLMPGIGLFVILTALCIYADIICAPIARHYGLLSSQPTRPTPDQFIPRPDPELVARTRNQNAVVSGTGSDERQPLLGLR